MKQVALGVLVVTALLPIGSCQKAEPDYPPRGGGSGASIRAGTTVAAQGWYHLDQGTAFFPYDWFITLEQAQGQARFVTTGNMQRFGFLPNPRTRPTTPMACRSASRAPRSGSTRDRTSAGRANGSG